MEVGVVIKEQYNVVEHIGRGGMADVWSARDTRLNRMVAIKTIAHGLSQDVDPVALFEREAQTIAQIEHPHILPIYDFGSYKNSLYIVMRFVTGGSLEDTLEGGALPINEALRMGQAVAQALDHAHAEGVIHLDLKPPNILLDSSNSPYLADFGLATVLDAQGRAQNPGAGTLLYMAPEQLVAEVIDHRTDIYSFAIVLYHMLTGQMPFEGAIPLALKQLQFQEEMPELHRFVPDLPPEFTDILRRATAVDPDRRPLNLLSIVEAMREAVMGSITLGEAYEGDVAYDGSVDPTILPTEPIVNLDDAGVLEAADIYARAKHAWQGGHGHFLLGISHYMLMSGYYRDADMHGLAVDEKGLEMLLRGALEYDLDIDYWWEQVDVDSQRWVCLHTIRSESAPARIRAFYRLETLPDDNDAPKIPKLVAEAVEIETNEEAKVAGLTVLGTRARLLKPRQHYDIKSEFRGRLLSTTTRLGIQLRPPDVWEDAIYTPEIDMMIAEAALDLEKPEASELAARIIGRMHSLTAVRFVATEQKNGTPGALRALGLIRDEAPYLPDVVSRQGRIYAWLTNTVRRMTDEPLHLILRFVLALLGAWIGFGQQVYITYRNQLLFIPQRWGNTIAVGLLMGVFVAVVVLITDEFSRRLRGFWPWWLRLLISGVLGFLLSTLTWAGYTWMYLNQPFVYWDVMRLGGFGLAFGFLISALLNLRGWVALIVTGLSLYIPIYVAFYNSCTLLGFYCTPNFEPYPMFSIAPTAIIGLVAGFFLGFFLPRPELEVEERLLALPNWAITVISGGLGLLWTLGVWWVYNTFFQQQAVFWDGLLLLFIVSMLIGMGVIYWLNRTDRLAFIATSTISFGLLYAQLNDFFQQVVLAPQQYSNDYVDPLFSYDRLDQVVLTAIPVVLAIGLGAFAIPLFRNIRAFIGEVPQGIERKAWMTGTLLMIMSGGLLIGVMAPFSAHVDVGWAIGWSLLGFLTFIFGLATWHWQRWGARGLVISAIAFIIGGFLIDIRNITMAYSAEVQPELLTRESLLIWGTWAIWVAVLVVGVLRRRLWSGMGLIVMIVLWFVVGLFVNQIGDNFTILSLMIVALVMFALRPNWEKMVDRVPQKSKRKIGAGATSALQPALAGATAGGTLDTNVFGDVPISSEMDERVGSIDDPSEKATQVSVSNSVQGLETNVNIYDDLANNMETELDAKSILDDELQDRRIEEDEVATTFKPKFTLDTSKIKQDEFEGDDDTATQVKPKFTLDTSKVKADDTDVDINEVDTATVPKVDPSSQDTQLSVDLLPDEDTVKVPKDKMSKAVQAIEPDELDDTDLKETLLKPRAKLDTSQVQTDTNQMETELDAKAVYESEKETQLKPKFTLDTSLVKTGKSNDESGDEVNEDSKATQMKPKFTLDTSLVKKQKESEEDTDEEETE